jgi:hypothetical protein
MQWLTMNPRGQYGSVVNLTQPDSALSSETDAMDVEDSEEAPARLANSPASRPSSVAMPSNNISTISRPRSSAYEHALPVGESSSSQAVGATYSGTVYSIPLPENGVLHDPPFDFSTPMVEEIVSRLTFDTDSAAYHPEYTLPPLKALPAEYSRRGKPGKQQKKRDKERGKDDRADGRKDDGFMSIQRWGANIKTNPTWKYVSQSQKALSSQDWAVCFGLLLTLLF